MSIQPLVIFVMLACLSRARADVREINCAGHPGLLQTSLFSIANLAKGPVRASEATYSADSCPRKSRTTAVSPTHFSVPEKNYREVSETSQATLDNADYFLTVWVSQSVNSTSAVPEGSTCYCCSCCLLFLRETGLGLLVNLFCCCAAIQCIVKRPRRGSPP